ncbi:MAG: hypothetical protein ACLT8E_03995 [Akkermansia sp.]
MVTPAFSDCVNKLGVDENDVIPFGRNKAKISLDVLDKPAAPGKLIRFPPSRPPFRRRENHRLHRSGAGVAGHR